MKNCFLCSCILIGKEQNVCTKCVRTLRDDSAEEYSDAEIQAVKVEKKHQCHLAVISKELTAKSDFIQAKLAIKEKADGRFYSGQIGGSK